MSVLDGLNKCKIRIYSGMQCESQYFYIQRSMIPVRLEKRGGEEGKSNGPHVFTFWMAPLESSASFRASEASQ